jgi:hypothetical protein
LSLPSPLTTHPPHKLGLVVGSVAPIPLGRCRHTTHHPSHKQLLVRLEAGGALFVGMRSWWWWAVPLCTGGGGSSSPLLVVLLVVNVGVPPSSCHLHSRSPAHCITLVLVLLLLGHSTSNPPHEQLLVRLGAGGVLFLRHVVPSPSPVVVLTPPSRVPACGVTCVSSSPSS